MAACDLKTESFPEVLGYGTISTVYRMPPEPSKPKEQLVVKLGSDVDALQAEFETASIIWKARRGLICHSELLDDRGFRHHNIVVPQPMGFVDRERLRSCKEYEGMFNHEAGKAGGLVLERIPTLPSAVGRMMIRRYFAEDDIESAIARGEDSKLMIRLKFGTTEPEFNICPPRKERVFNWLKEKVSRTTKWRHLPALTSLVDMPATLPMLKAELPRRCHDLVEGIAVGYAIMHWACFIDGAGVEFVLANYTPSNPRLRVWMHDFDKCRKFDMPTAGTKKAVSRMHEIIQHHFVPVLLAEGYTPRVGEEKLDNTDHDCCLWDTWKETYIRVGKLCLDQAECPHLLDGPQTVCDAFELAVALDASGTQEPAMVFGGSSSEDDTDPVADFGWDSEETEVKSDFDGTDSEDDSDEEQDYRRFLLEQSYGSDDSDNDDQSDED